MKNLLFSLIVSVLFVSINYANENPKFNFPKYSKKLFTAVDCSCTGAFSACSASGNCSCSCGYFSCSCTSTEPKTEEQEVIASIDISISKEQFQNIEKLAYLLNSLNEKKAVSFLANMIEILKIKDALKFHENRQGFLNEIFSLSFDKKEKLNSFFVKIGAEERV